MRGDRGAGSDPDPADVQSIGIVTDLDGQVFLHDPIVRVSADGSKKPIELIRFQGQGHLLGEGNEMGCGKAAGAVLHEVEKLDQQITASRSLTDQRTYIQQRLGIDLATLGDRWTLASSTARVRKPHDG